VEVAPDDILYIIFKDYGVLDYNMFEKKLDEIKEWVLSQGERENIRIKMKEINEEE